VSATPPNPDAAQGEAREFARAVSLISTEISTSTAGIHVDDAARLFAVVEGAQRVFVVGAGRSGLIMKMAAMRLMHLGLHAFATGESTTPAIAAGDLLIAASGSGTTSTVVNAAATARKVGAELVAFTTAPASPLAELATVVVTIPAQAKTDHGSAASAQYAGSLFEQSLLVATDALFHRLWERDGSAAEELWPRHANLE